MEKKLTTDDEWKFLREEISDIQDTIKAQDTKIGLLLVICFLPINQSSDSTKILYKLLIFPLIGKIIIIILSILWLLSICFLLYGIYPRFKKIKPNFESNKTTVSSLKQELSNLYDVLMMKVNAIKFSLWLIASWCLIIILVLLSIN